MHKPVTGVFQFIRAERNQGVSKPEKGSKPYDFATMRVTDGLDSFNLDIKPDLEQTLNQQVSKGDFIEVRFEVGERFKNTTYIVDSFKKLQQAPKAI